MKYNTIISGQFVSRPNRFIAQVQVDGAMQTVHVKNTGRCKELLLPGADVRLEVCDNPNRKTKYDLVAVYKPSLGWVNIDSQAPNKAAAEWKGQLLPVVGRVCMDQCMFLATGTDARAGDEVTLLGRQVTAETLAGYADTISYEILTGLTARVPRVYVQA